MFKKNDEKYFEENFRYCKKKLWRRLEGWFRKFQEKFENLKKNFAQF